MERNESKRSLSPPHCCAREAEEFILSKIMYYSFLSPNYLHLVFLRCSHSTLTDSNQIIIQLPTAQTEIGRASLDESRRDG
jgi:hypothetical protein